MLHSLVVEADSGIVIEKNLTALNGSIGLDGNANNISQASGTVVIHDGVALVTKEGQITLGHENTLNASMSILGTRYSLVNHSRLA